MVQVVAVVSELERLAGLAGVELELEVVLEPLVALPAKVRVPHVVVAAAVAGGAASWLLFGQLAYFEVVAGSSGVGPGDYCRLEFVHLLLVAALPFVAGPSLAAVDAASVSKARRKHRYGWKIYGERPYLVLCLGLLLLLLLLQTMFCHLLLRLLKMLWQIYWSSHWTSSHSLELSLCHLSHAICHLYWHATILLGKHLLTSSLLPLMLL